MFGHYRYSLAQNFLIAPVDIRTHQAVVPAPCCADSGFVYLSVCRWTFGALLPTFGFTNNADMNIHA